MKSDHTTSMIILATNKATKRSKSDNVLDFVNAGVCIITALALLLYLLAWMHSIESTDFSLRILFGLWLAMGIVMIYLALMCIDNYLRWNRGLETVWVDNGVLVIDCECSILRKHKEILLSSIIKVKQYNNIESLRGLDAPDRLKVIYSGIRRYRFGMCMNSYERDTLAKIIMALAEESKRKEEAGKTDDSMK